MYVKGFNVSNKDDCMFYHTIDLPNESVAGL